LLGLLAVMVAPGVPMIYSGQEFGEDSPRTIDFQPLHWGKLLQRTYADYSRLIKRLIQARHAHPALRSDEIEFYVDNFPAENVVRLKRWHVAANDYATAALNFGGVPRTVILEVPWPGTWHEIIHDTRVQLVENRWQTTLGPWQGALLVPAGAA